jgi:hypothetical protein
MNGANNGSNAPQQFDPEMFNMNYQVLPKPTPNYVSTTRTLLFKTSSS